MTEHLAPGTVIDGRFELRAVIDSGGLATVWRAYDRETDAPVAIKCENDESHDRAQVRAHFREELRWFRRFAAGPTPGSLVQFVDGAVDDGSIYVATELIAGGSVLEWLGDEVEPGPAAFRTVGAPVCRAIAFLHRAGVVHLDLKPSNVLVRRRGPPAVIDLNSAVSTDEGTGTLFHHDPFKPPELAPTDARDDPVGPWSDVYALGKLLVHLLTGETVPFEASSLDAWHAVDPRDLGADCPPELAAVLERATAPRYADRFDDADALYASLASHFEVPAHSARFRHGSSGQTVLVHPGDAVGRWSADERVPAVVLPDEGRHLSPEHAVLERDGGTWSIRDRSLNGTHVRTPDGWRYVLSAQGLERRREASAPLPQPDPDASIRLFDGDRIAPVSPDYGCTLRFRED